jgi:hypothetical protein
MSVAPLMNSVAKATIRAFPGVTRVVTARGGFLVLFFTDTSLDVGLCLAHTEAFRFRDVRVCSTVCVEETCKHIISSCSLPYLLVLLENFQCLSPNGI